jgi:glycosyltransferase involved in cell wall biosynthesis
MVSPGSVSDAMTAGEAHEYIPYANALFTEALRGADSFDVIHCHLGYPFVPLGLLARTPVLHTLHTVPAPDDLWVLGHHPEVPVAAVSRHQARAIPSGRLREVRVVPHGIDFETYHGENAPGKYLAFLGRMGPQKSPLDAVRVGRAAGLPLVLAGKPQNAEEELYFAREVRPLIDGNAVRYAGPVNHAQKVELLRGAAALLFPIRGEEAFGLAMVEAMACGTPVIGYDTATVSEIIDPGVTGFFGRTPEELAGLVPRALALDRRAVREHARRRFSHTRMADDYVALYRELVPREGGA